jgi:thiamine-phosphate pyrophosphorylase
MKTTRISGLYAITPDTSDVEKLLGRVEACLKGGVRLLQYRNKNLSAPHLDTARALSAMCREYEAILIVNDDSDLAAEVCAQGVHLGRKDGDIAVARQKLGPDSIIGISCYDSLERALQAQRAGADYIAFGSVFASSTKPHAAHAPLSLLTEAAAQLHIPIVAIGGITLQNASQVITAGADAIAVISAAFDAADITKTAQDFSNLFKTIRS